MTDSPSIRCLVADSSRMVRRVAGRILRDLGLTVTEAATGREALDQCRLNLPEVVLLDTKVGDMDGLDVLRAIRELAGNGGDQPPKVIVCSSERSPRTILTALEAGADEYIMKPFDSDIIEAKLIISGVLERDRAA